LSADFCRFRRAFFARRDFRRFGVFPGGFFAARDFVEVAILRIV
jgi:hypothetical protein